MMWRIAFGMRKWEGSEEIFTKNFDFNDPSRK